MSKNGLIVDADAHLFEDWRRVGELTDKRYRAQAPQIISQGPSELLLVGGQYLAQAPGFSWADTNRPNGLRGDNRGMGKWAESDPLGFDAKARLKVMDEQGVDAAVIFPSLGLTVANIQDPRAAAAVCRGINRYNAEFCAADPARLWNTAALPVSDIDAAIAEARYAVRELGARLLMTPTSVVGAFPLYHPSYDPLFDEIADLGVPFVTHNGGAVLARGGMASERYQGRWAPYHIAAHSIEAEMSMLGFLTYGVLDRRPGLRVGFFEAGCGWVPFMLQSIEGKYRSLSWLLPELTKSPSEVFARQCLVTAEAEDDLIGSVLERLDGRGVAWSSDMPHFDCGDYGTPAPLVETQRLDAVQKRRVLSDNLLEFLGVDAKKLSR